MQLLRVPQGESPNRQDGEPGPAVVICRGETTNIWVNHRSGRTGGYPTINEAEAVVFGLAAQPGTPDDTYVSVIRDAVQNRHGRRLGEVSPPDGSRGDVGSGRSLDDVLREAPAHPPGHEDFQRPWDLEQWNTPAGEDPKRTPLHTLYERARDGGGGGGATGP